MPLAEGIRIQQYMDDWLMETRQNINTKRTPTSPCRKPGLDNKFLKIRFNSNSRNQIFGYNGPQGMASLPNSKKNSIVFSKRQLPCWKLLTHLQGCPCHFGSMASMEKTIPLVCLHMKSLEWYLKTHCRYLQSLDISFLMSMVNRDYLQWWTNLSILKEVPPLLQKEHSLLPFTDASLKGWGAHVKHRTASGLWNQEETRLLLTF